MAHTTQGVHCAVATPVTARGEPDVPLYTAHCKALLHEGCHGLAMLGTTGEANSFGLTQRKSLLESTVDAGVPPGCLLPGTSAPSVADTIELTSHAVRAEVKGCVLLPPYYYKSVSDEGLFRFYARVIETVADERLRVVLYHIPQISQMPVSHNLIDRLMTCFPGVVTGIKDSKGDLGGLKALCERFPELDVLTGADPLMRPLLAMGGAGCITATSNLCAEALREVWDGRNTPEPSARVDSAQARITAWRTLSNRYAQLPTLKTLLMHTRGNKGWLNMMPPLVELTRAEREDVWAECRHLQAQSPSSESAPAQL